MVPNWPPNCPKLIPKWFHFLIKYPEIDYICLNFVKKIRTRNRTRGADRESNPGPSGCWSRAPNHWANPDLENCPPEGFYGPQTSPSRPGAFLHQSSEISLSIIFVSIISSRTCGQIKFSVFGRLRTQKRKVNWINVLLPHVKNIKNILTF